MKKNVLIFGLVLGLLLCVNMIFMVNQIYTNPNFNSNYFIGYAILLVIFSLIFFGVRNYRNKKPGRFITFWNAFLAGALIAFVGSLIYVVVWLFYYYLFVPDFIDVYSAHVLKDCSPADLTAKTAEMENLKSMYKNPGLIVLLTFMEVLPFGLLIALASSFLLKKKNKK